jgi:hypothetical protein
LTERSNFETSLAAAEDQLNSGEVMNQQTSSVSGPFLQFLGKAEDAAEGGRDAWVAQSTGERLAVALALNRPDWLASMGYTIAEAIDRVDDWIPLVRPVERSLRDRGLI